MPETTPAQPAAPPINYGALMVNCCRALAAGALRLKPRERQLALLLAVESFAVGASAMVFDLDWICNRLGPAWRRGELTAMLGVWQRAGWIAVDVAASELRLAPDRLPGWADCFPCGNPDGYLPLGGVHLGSMVAEISQHLAVRNSVSDAHLAGADKPDVPDRAEISQCAKISQVSIDRARGDGAKISQCENFAAYNVKTFKRSDVSTIKRLTLGNGTVRNFRREEDSPVTQEPAKAEALKRRVAEFVGELDWREFWRCGRGWRKTLFTEEADRVEGCLDFVISGLKTGELKVKKTRGAMLWDAIQRRRKDDMQG